MKNNSEELERVQMRLLPYKLIQIPEIQPCTIWMRNTLLRWNADHITGAKERVKSWGHRKLTYLGAKARRPLKLGRQVWGRG